MGNIHGVQWVKIPTVLKYIPVCQLTPLLLRNKNMSEKENMHQAMSWPSAWWTLCFSYGERQGGGDAEKVWMFMVWTIAWPLLLTRGRVTMTTHPISLGFSILPWKIGTQNQYSCVPLGLRLCFDYDTPTSFLFLLSCTFFPSSRWEGKAETTIRRNTAPSRVLQRHACIEDVGLNTWLKCLSDLPGPTTKFLWWWKLKQIYFEKWKNSKTRNKKITNLEGTETQVKKEIFEKQLNPIWLNDHYFL